MIRPDGIGISARTAGCDDRSLAGYPSPRRSVQSLENARVGIWGCGGNAERPENTVDGEAWSRRGFLEMHKMHREMAGGVPPLFVSAESKGVSEFRDVCAETKGL